MRNKDEEDEENEEDEEDEENEENEEDKNKKVQFFNIYMFRSGILEVIPMMF